MLPVIVIIEGWWLSLAEIDATGKHINSKKVGYQMNKFRLAGVAVAAAVTTPISAYALNFDFTFTGGHGGVVSGEVFGLKPSGPSSATDIYIDSVPSSLDNPVVPYDLFAKLNHATGTNTFSVSNGSVVAYTFNVFTDHPGTLGLLLSPGTVAYDANGTFTESRGQRGSAVTFTPAAAAPEPASIALLGAGLAGISAFRRRRAR